MIEPTPYELNENPELGVLAILDSALVMATVALVAAFPEKYYGEEARQGTELEAYADAIIAQIESLGWILDSYRQGVKRQRASLHSSSSREDDLDAWLPAV